MTAVIETPLGKATITNYRWRSENKELAALLNDFLDPSGPPGYDPNPDYSAALDAVDRLPMKNCFVLSYEKVEYDPKAIY